MRKATARCSSKDELRKQLQAARREFERQVAQAIRDCPSMTQIEIAGRFGISRQEISAIATRHGAKRKRGAGSPASTQWRKCLVE
jgi:hypothetical protein